MAERTQYFLTHERQPYIFSGHGLPIKRPNREPLRPGVDSGEYNEPAPADRSLPGIRLIYAGFAADAHGACDGG